MVILVRITIVREVIFCAEACLRHELVNKGLVCFQGGSMQNVESISCWSQHWSYFLTDVCFAIFVVGFAGPGARGVHAHGAAKQGHHYQRQTGHWKNRGGQHARLIISSHCCESPSALHVSWIVHVGAKNLDDLCWPGMRFGVHGHR